MASEFGVKVEIIADAASATKFKKSIQDMADKFKDIHIPQITVKNDSKSRSAFNKSMQNMVDKSEASFSINKLKINEFDYEDALNALKDRLSNITVTISTDAKSIEKAVESAQKAVDKGSGRETVPTVTKDTSNDVKYSDNLLKQEKRLNNLISLAKGTSSNSKTRILSDEFKDGLLPTLNQVGDKINELKGLEQQGTEIADADIKNIVSSLDKVNIEIDNAASSARKITKDSSDASERSVTNFATKIEKYISANPKVYKRFAEEFDQMRETVTSGAKVTTEELDKFQTKLADIDNKAEGAGIKGQTSFRKLLASYLKFGSWDFVTKSLSAAIRAIKDMVNATTELDSSLAQLKIVTGESDATIERFADKVFESAKKLGASATDIISSAETWARLGYTLNESLNLSEITTMLSNVADTDIGDATTSMTAILKGYDLDASEAERVADVLTLIGQKYAISAEGLGEALQNGGASLEAANNTLEQSVAILAAGNAAVQDASSVGK